MVVKVLILTFDISLSFVFPIFNNKFLITLAHFSHFLFAFNLRVNSCLLLALACPPRPNVPFCAGGGVFQSPPNRPVGSAVCPGEIPCLSADRGTFCPGCGEYFFQSSGSKYNPCKSKGFLVALRY